MRGSRISVPEGHIRQFCERHSIRRLALFGSVLRDDFGPKSDVDVLVEFTPGHSPGLKFFDLQDEASAIFGRHVDLNTADFLSPFFREQALADAQDLYVRA
ncbi:MAG: nucleotidyltransferase family protein [Terracidiphilus sp.]